MEAKRGKAKKVALLQISVKNMMSLQTSLSAQETLDLIAKVYIKVKNIIKDRGATLYKFTGTDFFIIFDKLEGNQDKLENVFYLAKEIFDKLKKHNAFLLQNQIPSIEYTFALDYNDALVGIINYNDVENTVILGAPFKITARTIALNERKNITPFFITENLYTEIKDILSEYFVSVMGFIRIENQEIYLYGSYQFNF